MKLKFVPNAVWLVSCCLPTCLFFASVTPAAGQSGSDNGGYSIGEQGASPPTTNTTDRTPNAVPDSATQDEGPVRLARFSYVSGSVTWRTDETAEWSSASLNIPLRQGSQISVSDGGRAEVQFDDGSVLRLGNGAVITLQTLYSDADGEFTEIKQTDGVTTLRLKHDRSIYQVDTPLVSVKADGPARIRLGVADGVEVAVQSGKATIEGSQGKADMQSGDYLDIPNADAPYSMRGLPRADSWEQWNADRDRLLDGDAASPSSRYLPADIAIVAGDLDEYGTWRDDSRYGHVWCPRVSSSNWRPYYSGRWTWVNPFGWTWVSDEAWGWAPYHYGTWVSEAYGWAWVPGPVNQYWCPAVVHFCEYDGRVAWVPLAPAEVRYPTVLSIGFRSGNWAGYFSIAQAAVYYPAAYGSYSPSAWGNRFVNRVTYVKNVTNVTNIYNGTPSQMRYAQTQEAFAANHNTYSSAGVYVPLNARSAAGVTTAQSAQFGGGGSYDAVPSGETALFTRSRAISAPAAGSRPVAGPAAVQPTAAATTPSRTFAPGSPAATRTIQRPVYRAAVQPRIEQGSAPIAPAGQLAPRPPVAGAGGTVVPRGPVARTDRGTPAGRGPQRYSGAPVTRPPGASDPSIGRVVGGSTGSGSGRPPVTGSAAGSAADAARRARQSLGIGSRSRPMTPGQRGDTPVGRAAAGNSSGTGRGSGGDSYTPSAPARGADRTNPPPRQAAPPARQTDPPARQANPPSRQQYQLRYTAPVRNDPPRQPDPPRYTPRQPDPPARQANPPSRQQESPRYSPPVRSNPPRQEPLSRQQGLAPARDKNQDSGPTGDSGSRSRPSR